ncbi:ubiquitin-conjugating enzyme E2-binding protein [Mycotypha africana]|uniref:ubiquitin-conjugating enzyme E2-binding protein n=1 Tax=Mycotypha africana TaxID=64632 RepID=UPI002300D585|nr:ubiquitin-conjugating enzyme E2-binding protein [Mycotypha africana]KAI8970215.1 ubiquitin-conjugating enzyme E2-binding protein [Mycotypha africana]
MSPFYAEELQNISTLRACISVKPGYDVAKELRVNNNVLTLGNAVVADFSSVKVTVTTDNLIVEQPNTATSEKDKSQSLVPWEIKLNLVRSTDPQQQQIEVREWWTAKDLLKLGSHSNSTNIRNVQLQCRSCFEPLVNSQANYTIKDLPSEHWYELIECWICHEAKAGEHKSRMQPILARPNTLLVGTTYFLLHTDNILKDSIEVDSTVANCLDWNRGTKTKWITLNCRKCKHALGEGQYTIESNNQLIFPHQPSFIDFFVSDLVSTARVHATHRFLIQGRQSHRIYALVRF